MAKQSELLAEVVRLLRVLLESIDAGELQADTEHIALLRSAHAELRLLSSSPARVTVSARG
jgi:hypothetical protein